MLVNQHVAVSTNSVLLIPYSKHHVPKYHEWMKDPEIQDATASEPLSLEEEYAMQQSWRLDADKLTFIVCRPTVLANSPRRGSSDLDTMIGDVNMFITVAEDDGKAALAGELELMIAERDEQRKGYGRSALLAFLTYIQQHETDIIAEFTANKPDLSRSTFDHFAVKIGQANGRSIALFQSLGFTKISETPSYFGEYELRHAGLTVELVRSMTAKYAVTDYKELHYDMSS